MICKYKCNNKKVQHHNCIVAKNKRIINNKKKFHPCLEVNDHPVPSTEWLEFIRQRFLADFSAPSAER
jgi:hypothetical protein